jgi:hypothetical protein
MERINGSMVFVDWYSQETPLDRQTLELWMNSSLTGFLARRLHPTFPRRSGSPKNQIKTALICFNAITTET